MINSEENSVSGTINASVQLKRPRKGRNTLMKKKKQL